MRKEGQHHPQRGAEGAGQARQLRPHIGGDVHRKGARRTLADGDEVHQFFRRHPALGLDIRLDERQHGITAADGEQADLEEGQKQLQIQHHTALLFAMRAESSPTVALARITSTASTPQKAVSTKAPAMTA